MLVRPPGYLGRYAARHAPTRDLMKHAILYIFAIYACSALGCSVSENSSAAEPLDVDDPTDTPSPLLDNLLKITDRVYCGGEPQNQDAFAQLAALGIKTVVSVDGAQPDIEEAHRHGLRYVHIPIGYDGIHENAGLSLARLVRDADGPFYIHCHHGRHRGPTAAAVACIAAGELDQKSALDVLQRAGTSKDYGGLWRAVETYRVPPNDAELPKLVEVAEISSFLAAMAHIDRAYDNLKLCRDAGWVTPSNHPDLVPHQQALLLKEGFRESRRNLSDGFGPPIAHWIADAENIAQNVEDALAANDQHTAAKEFRVLAQSCTRCHERYRN